MTRGEEHESRIPSRLGGVRDCRRRRAASHELDDAPPLFRVSSAAQQAVNPTTSAPARGTAALAGHPRCRADKEEREESHHGSMVL